MPKMTFMRVILCLVSIVGFWVSLVPSKSFAQSVKSVDDLINDLVLYTEPYPPFNFEADKRLQGISVDLMEKMLEKVGSKLDRENMRIIPWAHSYMLVQKYENVGLFSMTRTEHREKLFKWVGPIAPTIIGLTARKDRNVKIDSFDDIEKYQVGVIREDIASQLLIKGGLPKTSLQEVSETKQNIDKLNSGRIDIWAYAANVAKWELKSNGFDPNDYELVYVLQKGVLWYAFNLATPDSVIRKLQSAYDKIVEEGEYQKILCKYLK